MCKLYLSLSLSHYSCVYFHPNYPQIDNPESDPERRSGSRK